MSAEIIPGRVPTGPAAAALLASGIGVLVLGLMTTGAAIDEGLSDALNWQERVGPLSGKTGVGVAAWLITRGVLHLMWRNRTMKMSPVFVATLTLIALALLLTFPPFFELFH